ncbi:DUF742 domain-containing protein [Streptomyces sp. S6]
MTGRPAGRPLVPAYLSTGGVARPSRPRLERLTVLARDPVTVRPEGLSAAELAVLDALSGGALALVEVAAVLRLPVSAVRVLIAGLLDKELLLARAPVASAAHYDPDLLKRVADGLRALKR